MELKSIFCKIFDPDMSPLGFDAREMYGFISKRFVRTPAEVQQQESAAELLIRIIASVFPYLYIAGFAL